MLHYTPGAASHGKSSYQDRLEHGFDPVDLDEPRQCMKMTLTQCAIPSRQLWSEVVSIHVMQVM